MITSYLDGILTKIEGLENISLPMYASWKDFMRMPSEESEAMTKMTRTLLGEGFMVYVEGMDPTQVEVKLYATREINPKRIEWELIDSFKYSMYGFRFRDCGMNVEPRCEDVMFYKKVVADYLFPKSERKISINFGTSVEEIEKRFKEGKNIVRMVD